MTKDTRHHDQHETACGCEVWQTHNGHVYIEQCPLHAKAQELYDMAEHLIKCRFDVYIPVVNKYREIRAQATGATPHEPR